MKRRRALAAVLVVGAFVWTAPLGCNVFVSLEHCRSDGDCRSARGPDFRCDIEAQFCVRDLPDVREASRSETGPSDAGVDADSEADADAAPPCNLTLPFESIE